tara:strand:- start:36 stop:1355 length:1320 start_codon:yes stop_codon:yes gene_type:complete
MKNKVITDREMRALQKAGYEAPLYGKRRNRPVNLTNEQYYLKNKKNSSPSLLVEMAGKGGQNLSHLSISLDALDSLKNLGYLPKDINIKSYHAFEKKILANAKDIYAAQNNKNLSILERRAKIAEFQKKDRALRKQFPRYADIKARLQVQATNLDSSGVMIKEKLPNPTVAISQEPGMTLKGLTPSDAKGKEIIEKAKTSLALVLKKAGFKSNGNPNDPQSYLADINKQEELTRKGKSGASNKFNNISKITKNLFKGVAAIDAPGLAVPFTALSIKKLISDVISGEKTNVTGAEITLAPAFTHLAAKELGLYDKAATGIGKKLLRGGLTPKFAAKLLPGLSYASTLSLPFIETGIQSYNAYRDLEEARKNSSVFEPTVDTLMGKAPESYYNEMMSNIPAKGKLKTFNNPFTGKPMFTLPEVGIEEFSAAKGGIASLLKK